MASLRALRMPRYGRSFAVAGYVCASLFAVVLFFRSPPHRVRSATVAILQTPRGDQLRLEVAQTPQQRTLGLSQQDRLPHDGLVLVWPRTGQHPITMESMRFSLDLIWLDTNGRILAVEADAPPCPAPVCLLYGVHVSTTRAVLELEAGQTRRLGLRIGDQIGGPFFTP